MEPTKKPKVIYFLKDKSTEVEKVINEFYLSMTRYQLKV